MKLRVDFHADVTDFHPAADGKECAELLRRKMNDALVEVLKYATEQTGLIPLKNDLHKTGKTWKGKATTELSIERVDDPPSKVEETYEFQEVGK